MKKIKRGMTKDSVKRLLSRMVILILYIPFLSSQSISAETVITVLCGAAFSKPFDEITESFQKERGIKVYTTYASVPSLLAQLQLGRRGDILVTPTQDIMTRAAKKGIIVASSMKNFAYMAPVIAVQKGNPLGIKSIRDLARKGIRIALADPNAVYIGCLAAEIMEKNLTSEELKMVKSNVVTYMEDFSKLTAALILKQVDAIVAFHYVREWYPEKVDIIKFKPNEVQVIGAGQAAIISYSPIKGAALDFLEFLDSYEAKAIFSKYHYFSSPKEAFQWVGEKKTIGGECQVSSGWIGR